MKQDFYDVLYRAASLWSPRQRETHPGWFPSNPCNRATTNNSSSTGPPPASSAAGKPFPPLPARLQEEALEEDGVLVEEEILPELWLPGRIIHIYINRGQYHAAEVERTFPELRRIELQSNIFKDHLR
jgi:hypothetical protein